MKNERTAFVIALFVIVLCSVAALAIPSYSEWNTPLIHTSGNMDIPWWLFLPLWFK